jgi:ClpP class serine protease
MEPCFLHPDIYEIRREAYKSPEFLAARAARGGAITAGAADGGRENGEAVINIRGILTPTPDFFAEFFGEENTTYPDIQEAVAAAEMDPAVDRIRFDIDSPGGTVAGAFDTADILAGCRKKTRARILGQAASAAYLLASQAGTIEAASPAAMVGSIGIVATAYLDPERVDITSTEAPDKRPDLSTDQGRQVIREQLDGLHGILVEKIAAGRRTTPEAVNRDFGRGRMILAQDALGRGMIDAVRVNGPTEKKPGGDQGMNLQELKAQHPDVYAAAVAEGVAQERARVETHLQWNARPGCQAIALEAIRAGAALDPEMAARYADATVAAVTAQNRADDDPEPVTPEPVTPAPADPETDGQTADEVAARVAAYFGLEEPRK